ncbi:hypothetical protein [Coleofasciculus sp. FACHB-SPT36]|uniref:hypothetical protein n=1 Tax=Cyanophyceae TaxID=3028117 RepID=UPI00168BE60C|nr:hypothetical protein [Coleofasciculus sp. FACHB-SPT36]MBD2538296.1 hypothetical protein [Coleofasciculus sp. FACHB-SPT36]
MKFTETITLETRSHSSKHAIASSKVKKVGIERVAKWLLSSASQTRQMVKLNDRHRQPSAGGNPFRDYVEVPG